MPFDDVTREQLARYLDGDMAGTALQSFAQRLRDEPELRAEVTRQRQINQSLRRLFNVPAITLPESLPAHAGNGVSREPVEPAIAGTLPQAPRLSTQVREHSHLGPWVKRLGIAAALLLCAGGAWFAWQTFNPSAPQQSGPATPGVVWTAAYYYKYKIDRGFEPNWVCKDDVEFARTFGDRLGQPMLLKSMPDGSHMLGLDYTEVLTPRTISMLAEADGQKIVILVDKTASDNPDRINKDLGNLRAFRKEVGSLVLYEITPLDQSRVMDFLVQQH